MTEMVVEAALVMTAVFVGVILGERIARRADSRLSADAVPDIDTDDMEPLIQDAAERWASAIGRPEAAGLVVDKLRTLHRMKDAKPATTTRRRWSL